MSVWAAILRLFSKRKPIALPPPVDPELEDLVEAFADSSILSVIEPKHRTDPASH